MRIRRTWAAVVAIAILLSPLSALATTWEEWKFLMRNRPVAVLVAVPPLIATSPFMGAAWLSTRAFGEGDSGSESDDDDEDEEYDEDADE